MRVPSRPLTATERYRQRTEAARLVAYLLLLALLAGLLVDLGAIVLAIAFTA